TQAMAYCLEMFILYACVLVAWSSPLEYQGGRKDPVLQSSVTSSSSSTSPPAASLASSLYTCITRLILFCVTASSSSFSLASGTGRFDASLSSPLLLATLLLLLLTTRLSRAVPPVP